MASVASLRTMPRPTRLLAATVTAALLSAGTVAAQAGAEAPSTWSAKRYTVCNFDDPSVPKANTKYPFSRMLTSKTRRSSDRNVRVAVRSVQEILRSEGYRSPSGRRIVVDGDYGPATAYAVKQFQRRAGLVVDGAVGARTWRALGMRYCWKYH